MKRVAIYLRVSTETQAEEDKYSIPLQKEACINFCKAHQWLISEIFIDPGFSGDNLNRPGLQSLLARVKEFDIVLVFRLDRISRRTKNTLHLVEDIFLKNNIDFISIQESFDTTTPQGRLFLQQLASFAQYERDCITERMQMGRKARAKRGLYHGGGYSPIGYDYIDGKLIVNEYETLQVKEIFSLYLQGFSVRKISEKMQERKYTHKHGDWQYCKTVKTTLTNEIYTGRVIFDKISYRAVHESIISEEDFYKVQAILKSRSENKEKVYIATSLLTGFLHCGHCGSRYCKITKHHDGYRYNYYTCYSREKKMAHMIKNPNCKNKIWRMEQMDSIIEREISRKFAITPKKKEKKEKNNNKKEIIKKKITEIEKKINKLLDLYQIDGLAISEITEKIKKLNEEKRALQENIEEPEEKEEIDFFELKKKWKIQDFSLQEKRLFLEKIIKKIVLNGDRWEIYWKL